MSDMARALSCARACVACLSVEDEEEEDSPSACTARVWGVKRHAQKASIVVPLSSQDGHTRLPLPPPSSAR